MGAQGWVVGICHSLEYHSILGVATNSGSLWMFQAPTLYSVMGKYSYSNQY